VRLVADHLGEYPSLTAASAAVAKQVGVGHENVRRWVLQSQVDAGRRGGVTTKDLAEIRKLKAENRRLREVLGILRAATTFFAGELDPPSVDGWIHRDDEGYAVEIAEREAGGRADRQVTIGLTWST
jgi:transposase